jgi:predicted metal-dependent phosphotriesterase family hydrolase
VQFNDAHAHAAVLYDMGLYKKFGGSSVVENTSHGLQRNLQFMKEVSQKSGVHLIAGTGNSLTEICVCFKLILQNIAYLVALDVHIFMDGSVLLKN